jgi:hypothetical protein
MNKRHPYNHIIERKLEQLPVVDADHLWNDMHMILDNKMPQKKERRRFLGWFISGKGLLLLTVVVLTVTGSSLFFLSTKENSTVSNKKLPGSPQPDKIIEDGVARVSRQHKENLTTAGEPDQKIKGNISATAPSASAVGYVINNSFITPQTIKQPGKYKAKDQFSQPIQAISKARANFDIPSVNLKSIHQDFLIATNHNVEKKSLSQQQEPGADRVKTNTRNNNKNGLYAGIVSGVDLSSIHFQSVKTGATKGLIIGYAFNQKWSIESGLLWDKKRVYDNGSYFNPPGYTPTNGITIVAVNGKSRLYEWPVNMKYVIIPGKHSLFATAGLSSYFMRLENYDYEYVQNNQPGGHNFLSYKNETKNWFSVANFSIGYAHKLGEMGSIRLEPYLKLPIKNLGVGNMPIMSTGLNIGFTKTLRR